LSAPDSARASVRLGLTLRSVLVSPRVGFQSALQAAERRERTGGKSSEGPIHLLLAALAGSAGMLLWLKLSGMAQVRSVERGDYAPELLAAALMLGALIGVAAQGLWSLVGVYVARALGSQARPRDFRIAWGAAVFPQVFVLATLLPLDLVLIGPGAFTTQPLSDSLATAWAATSVALGVSVGIWSACLFVRGVQVAAGLSTLKAVVASLAAGSCTALVALLLVALTELAARAG
jgi:hypothetical protein